MQSLLKQRYCSTFQGSSVRYWAGKPYGSGETYTTNPFRPYFWAFAMYRFSILIY